MSRAVEAEVRRSRARIVEATDEERRRLERDLHDGAQQRLVTVSLALRRLRGRLASEASDADTVAAADEAAAELKLAIQELRELARGHPPGDPDRGRPGAGDHGPRRTLARARDGRAAPGSAPARGRRGDGVLRRLRGARQRRQARGRDERRASPPSSHATSLRIEVGDDGVGGADAAHGTGIRGLQDRVAAIGGSMAIESPAGQGTLAIVEIPIG